jgi:hypothetical protein
MENGKQGEKGQGAGRIGEREAVDFVLFQRLKIHAESFPD